MGAGAQGAVAQGQRCIDGQRHRRRVFQRTAVKPRHHVIQVVHCKAPQLWHGGQRGQRTVNVQPLVAKLAGLLQHVAVVALAPAHGRRGQVNGRLPLIALANGRHHIARALARDRPSAVRTALVAAARRPACARWGVRCRWWTSRTWP